MTAHRLRQGGDVDRNRPLRFSFEGRTYVGFAGDTLASALLANDVRVVGRSFKYHRPRGLLAAGAEEPNALMQIGDGAHTEVSPPATQIDLYDGLVARAVNCWPNVDFDVAAINGMIGQFIPAGFYYKTFLWPNWRSFEPFIRRAAGLGTLSSHADPDRYEMCFAHCDVLVVGSGPAGLAAARAASATGARVMLVEQASRLGGTLRWLPAEIDDVSGREWVENVVRELSSAPETRVMTRTTAIGYFDHNALALLETSDPQSDRASTARCKMWRVRAGRVVLATGAIERPIVFPGNDRPGVMLASAVARYIGEYGVIAGKDAVFFANNDSAIDSAEAYLDAGGHIAAFVDCRDSAQGGRDRLHRRGVSLEQGVIVATHGGPTLTAVTVKSKSGTTIRYAADLLAMSGGWSPTIHLHCQSGGKPRWDDRHACFVPGDSVQAESSRGASAGAFSLSAALEDGALGGTHAAAAAGFSLHQKASDASAGGGTYRIEPLWQVKGKGKAFVDFQNDVTTSDIELAHRENFVSVEHLKRYTTLGMAVDQGKTSNVNALAIMAHLMAQSIPDTGTTRYRFPYTPTPLGAFSGAARGELFKPHKQLPLHDWHAQHCAIFEEYAGWLRPAHYVRAGESVFAAEQREALAVRRSVGIFDASTLGKIEVVGRDAAKFLDRVYANTMSTLKVGQARYGIMLNELGVIIDDGIAARIGENHFLVGTTSAGAGRIAQWLEEWLQCEWTDYEVIIAPVTDAWAVITLTGPQARNLLHDAGVSFSIGAADFPHLSWQEGKVAGVPARLFRVSYTGEISYEINVAPSQALELWTRFVAAGAMPVGIDAWMLLRTERGFLHIGADTDGTTTPQDIGWGHVLKRKTDFIGRRSLTRPDNLRTDRPNFVGLAPLETGVALRVGAPVLCSGGAKKSDGCVTSCGHSPLLGRTVALGMVEDGRSRHGEIVGVLTSEGVVRVRIGPPGAYDPDGRRAHE